MKLLYDISKSFKENFQSKSTFSPNISQPIKPPKSEWVKLFDYTIASPLGIPACPLGISKNIKIMSQLGFSVFTYKTIRSHAFHAHPLPNIAYVDAKQQLTLNDINQPMYQTASVPKNISEIAISNSFGNASFEVNIMQQDIAKAREYISEGQVLVVSVFGVEQSHRSMIDDFAYTATLAQEAGAHIIELNLSCPNIKTCKPMHQESELVYAVCKKVAQAISIPFTIKVGIFEHYHQLQKTLQAVAQGGAQGICGINSIQMQVVTQNKQPYFGSERKISGVSGAPIRSLALEFIQKAQKIIQQEKLDLTILGTGGITKPEHFDQFFNAGANIALCATGAMWDPYLAIHYHELSLKRRLNGTKKERTYQRSL